MPPRWVGDQKRAAERSAAREAKRAEKGLLPISTVKTLFIEWLVNDRAVDESQADFARTHGVDRRELSEWKKDSQFVAEWERRVRETHGHPDKMHQLLQRLYERAAEKGDPKDVETYFRLVDKISPSRIEIDDKRKLAELSDDELAELAEELDNVEFLYEA